MSAYIIKGKENKLIGIYTDKEQVDAIIRAHDNAVCYMVALNIELSSSFMTGEMHGSDVEKIYDKNEIYDLFSDTPAEQLDMYAVYDMYATDGAGPATETTEKDTNAPIMQETTTKEEDTEVEITLTTVKNELDV